MIVKKKDKCANCNGNCLNGQYDEWLYKELGKNTDEVHICPYDVVEAQATHSALMDGGFTEKEADVIIARTLEGEDLLAVVEEYL